MKSALIGLALAGLMGVAAAVGCSSSSSGGGGGGGYSCPAVGSKACPSDPAVTQASVDLCNKCLSQFQAAISCDPGAATASCDANGMSKPHTPPSSCANQYAAIATCAAGGTGDGGSSSGGSSGGSSGSSSGGTDASGSSSGSSSGSEAGSGDATAD